MIQMIQIFLDDEACIVMTTVDNAWIQGLPGSGQGGGRWCGYPSKSFYTSLHSLGSLAALPALLSVIGSCSTYSAVK